MGVGADQWRRPAILYSAHGPPTAPHRSFLYTCIENVNNKYWARATTGLSPTRATVAMFRGCYSCAGLCTCITRVPGTLTRTPCATRTTTTTACLGRALAPLKDPPNLFRRCNAPGPRPAARSRSQSPPPALIVRGRACVRSRPSRGSESKALCAVTCRWAPTWGRSSKRRCCTHSDARCARAGDIRVRGDGYCSA